MDLTDVRRALRRFWLPALAVFVVTVAIGYLVGSRGGQRFESTAAIAVAPNPSVGGSASIVDYHVPVIVEKVGTRSFRAALGTVLADDTLDGASDLDAENEIDTGIVHITARGTDRDAVVEVANAAAEEITRQYAQPGEASGAGAVVVEILDEASPGAEVDDDMLSILLASAVLGAILAIGVAVLAQRSIRSLDPATRIRNEVGVPVLAVIPALPELKADDLDLEQLISTGPTPVVEAFQGLRTRVEVQLRDGASTLAVTSWQRNEGRTTITAALGLMLAAIGRDVVTIDADLREPHLHDRLGEPLAAGLAEFEQVGRDHIVSPTAHPRLGLVAAGVAKDHPSQILAVALPATLEQIGEQDPRPVMLVDAPPLRPARQGDQWVQLPAETATVLRAARRVLLVIDATAKHLPELSGAVERLREDGVVVVGAVLNRRRRSWPWRP